MCHTFFLCILEPKSGKSGEVWSEPLNHQITKSRYFVHSFCGLFAMGGEGGAGRYRVTRRAGGGGRNN